MISNKQLEGLERSTKPFATAVPDGSELQLAAIVTLDLIADLREARRLLAEWGRRFVETPLAQETRDYLQSLEEKR